MDHIPSSYAGHSWKMILSSWGQEVVVTLVCIYQGEHTKARKQTSLVELHHSNCLQQAHLRQVIFE